MASSTNPTTPTDAAALLAAEQLAFAVAEFEAVLSKLRIHGNYWLRPFLEGTKPLHLHLLSNPQLIKEPHHA